MVINEVTKNIITIESFHVPKKLQEIGYTDEVVINILNDKLRLIKTIASTAKGSKVISTADKKKSFELGLAGGTISIEPAHKLKIPESGPSKIRKKTNAVVNG